MLSLLKTQLRALDDWWYSRYGPIRVLFVVRNQYGLQCQLPVIKEASKRNNFSIAVTKEFDECIEWSDEPELQQLLQQYELPTKTALKRKWHYVIVTDAPYIWFSRNTTITIMPHGSGFGNLEKAPQADGGCDPYLREQLTNKDISLYLANSQAYEEYCHRLVPELKNNPSKKMVVTGIPRLDGVLTKNNSTRETFLESLGLPTTNKTIVISSHWTEKSLLPTLGAETINTVCSAYPDHNVLFMGHARLWRQGKGRILNQALMASLKGLERSHVNFRFLPLLENTQGLTHSADVFIGDHSSFIMEFCLLNKAIVVYDNPEFEFSEPSIGALYKHLGPSFSNLENLAPAILEAQSSVKDFDVQRKLLVNEFVGHLGGATNKTLDALEELGRGWRSKS